MTRNDDNAGVDDTRKYGNKYVPMHEREPDRERDSETARDYLEKGMEVHFDTGAPGSQIIDTGSRFVDTKPSAVDTRSRLVAAPETPGSQHMPPLPSAPLPLPPPPPPPGSMTEGSQQKRTQTLTPSQSHTQPTAQPQQQQRPDGSNFINAHIAHQYRSFRGRLGGRFDIIKNIVNAEARRTFKHRGILAMMIICWFFVIISLITFVVLIMFEATGGEDLDGGIFLAFYTSTSPFIILLGALLGGLLITDDLAHNLVPLYFSRPMTKLDYLLAKFLTIALFFSTVTIFPLTLMFLLSLGLAWDGFAWMIDQMWLLGAIWLHGTLMVLTFALISAAISSMTRKKYWATAGILIMVVSTETAGAIIAGITRSDYGFLFSVWLNLLNVGSVAYGEGSLFEVEWYYSLAVLAMVIAASMAVVMWQIVVKEGNR